MKTLVQLTVFAFAMTATIAAFGQSRPDRKADEAAIHAILSRIETIFAAGDVDAAMKLFTEDAVIFAENGEDLAGSTAIRAAYTGMVGQFRVGVKFKPVELEVAGDLAYERGLYGLKLTDKASGKVASDAEYRYIHIFKRQADGGWKTWRMMVNTPQAPVAAAGK